MEFPQNGILSNIINFSLIFHNKYYNDNDNDNDKNVIVSSGFNIFNAFINLYDLYLYIYLYMLLFVCVFAEIGDIAGVAEVTIRQSYKLMYPKAHSLFPEDFKFATLIEQLPAQWYSLEFVTLIEHYQQWSILDCVTSIEQLPV